MDETYIYADGNGNTYTITPNTFEYDPVKALQSSSGRYDGGDPVKKNISEDDYHKVKTAVVAAHSDRIAHIERRTMGSGMVTIKKEHYQTTFILAADTMVKDELEDVLTQLKS